MIVLSPHFTLEELTESGAAARHGIVNEPTAEQIRNLTRLANDVLEPVRNRFGPYRTSSGYRCPELNELIGGSPSSAHMEGRAQDGWPLGARDRAGELHQVMLWLKANRWRVPFDKAIYEYDRWVHIQVARDGGTPRGVLLQKFHARPYEPYRCDG